jgi:transcriptional regulator with XRE-family HTH domain
MKYAFRENLINARKAKDYTQKDLAALLGITEQHYQRLEAATSKGSVDVWEKLKALLDAPSIDCLLEQAQEKEKDGRQPVQSPAQRANFTST